MLPRPRLLPVPLEEREAVALAVSHHREVPHAAPVGEEAPLALLDPDGEVAAEARAVLPVIAIV